MCCNSFLLSRWKLKHPLLGLLAKLLRAHFKRVLNLRSLVNSELVHHWMRPDPDGTVTSSRDGTNLDPVLQGWNNDIRARSIALKKRLCPLLSMDRVQPSEFGPWGWSWGEAVEKDGWSEAVVTRLTKGPSVLSTHCSVAMSLGPTPFLPAHLPLGKEKQQSPAPPSFLPSHGWREIVEAAQRHQRPLSSPHGHKEVVARVCKGSKAT